MRKVMLLGTACTLAALIGCARSGSPPIDIRGSLGPLHPTQSLTFNTDTRTYSIDGGAAVVAGQIVSGKASIVVFDFSTITIPKGVLISASGHPPLGLVATGDIEIDAPLGFAGQPGQGGDDGFGIVGGGAGGGGGGGGAVLIASSTGRIALGGVLDVRGGGDGSRGHAFQPITATNLRGGGGGSGGHAGVGGGAGGSGGASKAGGTGGNGGAGGWGGGGGGGGGGGCNSGGVGQAGAGGANGDAGGAGEPSGGWFGFYSFAGSPTRNTGGSGGSGGDGLGWWPDSADGGAGGKGGNCASPGGVGGNGKNGVTGNLGYGGGGGGGGGGDASVAGPGGAGGASGAGGGGTASGGGGGAPGHSGGGGAFMLAAPAGITIADDLFAGTGVGAIYGSLSFSKKSDIPIVNETRPPADVDASGGPNRIHVYPFSAWLSMPTSSLRMGGGSGAGGGGGDGQSEMPTASPSPGTGRTRPGG